MENKSVSNAFEKHKGPETNSAKEDSVDITALVRSLQRTEGNPDCFRRTEDYCDQLDCSWRPYCLEVC